MNEWIARALSVSAGTVNWKATFMVAAMRSAAGGVAWAFISLLKGDFDAILPFLLLGAPFGMLFMIPIALISIVGSKIFPPIGFIRIIPLGYMVPGDPLLWLVERFRPGTVPIDDFKPINFTSVIIVFNSEVAAFVQNTKDQAVAAATQMGRDAIARFREQATANAKPLRGSVNSGGDTQAGASSDQEIYESARAEFKRLAAIGGNGEAMREQMRKIGALCEADCAIPGPYIFTADKFAQVDLVGNFDFIIDTLREGHANCAGSRGHQQEIETFFFGIAKLCWDKGLEAMAFRAYMDGLERWREAGNTISQSSPLLPRVAFVASRMFAMNAMERHDNTDLGAELFDFCEASGVDINIEIDVSDAPRTPS